MRVVIVGAGIGGLSAAIALRQKGIEVSVYERAPVLTEVGAGVSLFPNALKALHQLGMKATLDAMSFVSQEGAIRRASGTILSRTSARIYPSIRSAGHGVPSCRVVGRPHSHGTRCPPSPGSRVSGH